MSGPGSPARARPVERGEVSWVTLALLAALAGGGYLGWVWVPVYFELFQVKQVVRDHMNQAVKNLDDEGLRRSMVHRIRQLAHVDTVDAAGRPVRVPALVLDEGEVVWERHQGGGAPATLHVAFAYERAVVYPLVGKTDVRAFDVDLTGDLATASWGAAR